MNRRINKNPDVPIIILAKVLCKKSEPKTYRIDGDADMFR